MLEVVKGNLLDATEKYIAHQCNAVSNQAGGLAYYIFKKFPYADIYKNRPYPYKPVGPNFPGACFISGNGTSKRYVINMIAQYYPGGPLDGGNLLDGASKREFYFSQCLRTISYMLDGGDSIAFPFHIGCGLAAGNWKNYYRMLESFSIKVNTNKKVRVAIYDNEGT